MFGLIYTILMPDVIIKVCRDSPVSAQEVRAALDVWDYPEDLYTVVRGRCEPLPEPGIVQVRLFTEADKNTLSMDEATLAVTERSVLLLNNYVGLAYQGVVRLPKGADSRTTLHEFGHLVGRIHSGDPLDVMYPYHAETPYFVERFSPGEIEGWWGAAMLSL